MSTTLMTTTIPPLSKSTVTSTQKPQSVSSTKTREWVEYQGDRGFINFRCDQCVTICVREFPEHPARNVNVVVYHYDFDKIIYLDSK